MGKVRTQEEVLHLLRERRGEGLTGADEVMVDGGAADRCVQARGGAVGGAAELVGVGWCLAGMVYAHGAPSGDSAWHVPHGYTVRGGWGSPEEPVFGTPRRAADVTPALHIDAQRRPGAAFLFETGWKKRPAASGRSSPATPGQPASPPQSARASWRPTPVSPSPTPSSSAITTPSATSLSDRPHDHARLRLVTRSYLAHRPAQRAPGRASVRHDVPGGRREHSGDL